MSLAIIGASGKLGLATLNAIINENLIPPTSIVCTTSATEPRTTQWQMIKKLSRDVQVRHGTFDSPNTFKKALDGCDRLLLISSPRIALDFNDASPGTGREKDHIAAIEAARAVGVKHVYYTSLAFAHGDKSKAAVMTAHLRTEAYLKELSEQDPEFSYTAIREGLYNESWPLYFGHYDLKGGDDRKEVLVAGDSPISWTSIADLGFATALVLAAPVAKYKNKTFYLSNTNDPRSLEDIAGLVSAAKGSKVTLTVAPKAEHEKYYIEQRGMGEGNVKWWAYTYDALKDNECQITDKTLETLFKEKGREPKRIEETVKEMLSN